jgi:glycosyltransferase involved in cell wall biosynthesis
MYGLGLKQRGVTMKPRISVIVPVYNAEQYLCNCIDSILNQTLKEIEIILVNDGSSDKSAEICDSYEQLDKRVKVLHLENQGVSNARNRGIEIASGDYIGFVDADDWIEEQMYSNMLHEISKVNADVAICSHVIFGGNSERYVGLPWEDHSIFEKRAIAEQVIPVFLAPMDIEANSQQIVMGSVWKCLFHKEIIRRNKIEFDIKMTYTEDLIFLLHFLSKSEKILILDTPYYHYRYDIKNKTGITQKYVTDLYSNLARSNQHIKEILLEMGYLEKMIMHLEWRRISMVLSSINNICKKNSPYNFFERIQKANYFIDDSGFKKITDKLSPSLFNPRRKVIITLINHSLVGVVLAYYTLKNEIFFN